jgi:Family of unknown function (DUF6152)
MIRARVALAGAAMVLVATATPAALAHHGWSGYDANQTLDVNGVVTASGYEHPHGFIELEVPGKTWLVVLAPPSRMERRGLPKDALKPGTKASVVGYPSRTDPKEMRAERITIEGKTVELR